MSPEVRSGEEQKFRAYLNVFNGLFAAAYDFPELADAPDYVRVGHVTPDGLPRMTERTTSIMRTEEGYSLNSEDLDMFDSEFIYVTDGNLKENIGEVLFIGLGVAATVTQAVLESVPVNPLKTTSHIKEVNDFFADHGDIVNVFESIFGAEYGPGIGLTITSDMNDGRAQKINGLRLSFRYLFNVPGVQEMIGISYEEFIQKAREAIKQVYQRDNEYYVATLTHSMRNDEESARMKADQMFFSSLPDWVIAAACPYRDRELTPLTSPAWKFSPFTNPAGN
jgi:hypothetical protein